MSDQNAPAMSIVLVSPDRYETLRRMVRHLREQTIRDRLEIVIVAPSREGLGLIEEDLEGFHSHRIVEVGEVRSLTTTRAAGIRQASAPVVALTEDHCYPAPGWAEAMVGAHRRPWAGVGPAIGNANPYSRMSWLQLTLGYGPWVEPVAGVIDDLPGNNSCYKRSILLDYGPELEAMLEVPFLLHRDLRAKGHQLYLESTARLDHLNITRWSSLFQEHFSLGRRYAAGRAARWSRPRRLLYATVGIPWILLHYLQGDLGLIRRSSRRRELMPWGLPLVLICLAARGVGEAFGFALGFGRSRAQEVEIDTRRHRHLSRRDRALVGDC